MKYFTEDVILKFQRGGSNNKGKGKKDDKKGKKKTNNSGNSQQTTTSTSNYRTYTGPTTWMPQPIQPVIDNTGGLGYADNYNRRQTQIVEAQRQKAEAEEAAREAEYQAYLRSHPLGVSKESYFNTIKPRMEQEARREAEARRNQPTIQEDRRTPYERQLSEQYKRMTTPGTVEYARANSGYYQWYSDPNGTGAMQTAVNYTIPAAKQALGQYLDRPIGEILAGEGEGLARLAGGASQMLLSMPAAPVTEAQGVRNAINEGNGLDATQHFLMLGLSASPWVFNGIPAPSRVPVPSTATARVPVTPSTVRTPSFGIEWNPAKHEVLVPAPARVAMTPQGPIQVGGYRQMNIGGFQRAEGHWGNNGWFGRTKKSSTTPSAETPTPKPQATDDYTLGDIRYQKPFSRRRQKVTVTDPAEIETHTLNGEPISAEPKRTTVRTVNIKGQDYYNPQLTEVPTEAKAARTYYKDAAGNEYNNAFAVKGKKGKYYVNGPNGQRISVTQISEPGKPAGVKYQYNGVDVQPFDAQVYEYNGQYYPLSAYRRGTTTRTVKPGEVIPEDATWKAGKSKGNVEGQKFRTPRYVAKHGPDSWVDATGEPLPLYKNPGVYHKGAMGVAGASLLFGAPTVYKTAKWILRNIMSENGLVGGAIEQVNSGNNHGASTPDSNAIKMDERRIDSLQNDLFQKRQDTNNYNPAGFRRNQ